MARSNIFRHVLDEIVHQGPKPTSHRHRKRPDRVYGLSNARLIKDYLKSAKPRVRSLPFRKKLKAPHYPFLILEAKSEENKREDFPQMFEQTKSSIFTLLKLQVDLRNCASKDKERPCPFVWYLAFKGERWRLYACYWLDILAEALSVSSPKMCGDVEDY